MDNIPDAVPRVFHAAMVGYNIFIMWYWMNMDVPRSVNPNLPNLMNDWWQYLTVWNMLFQLVFFFICGIDDVLQSCTPRKALLHAKARLATVRDTLFQSLVLPLCMVVFGTFWVLFAYDRELVYPARMDAIVPFWFNHLLHTAVVFFPWVEVSLCQRPFVQRRVRFLCGLAVVGFYNVVFVTACSWKGYWPYPILGLMTPIQRILFYFLMYIMYTAAFLFGCKANDKICGGSVDIFHRGIDNKLW